jgi:hypothetical protein
MMRRWLVAGAAFAAVGAGLAGTGAFAFLGAGAHRLERARGAARGETELRIAERPWRDDERNTDDASGMRVTRGGSWYSASAVRLRLAYREEFQPELSSDDLGFRIAAVLAGGRN